MNHRLVALVFVSLAACERRPSEPPAPPREVPRLPTEAPRPPAVEPSRAQPTERSARDACGLLPEIAVRVFADVDEGTRVEREANNLAGLDSCRYRWRKRDAARITARNADRAQQNPALLAAIVRPSSGAEGLESAESELRLSVYPPRSGTASMLARGFEMAHSGEQPVAALGEQAAYNPARRLLTVRRGNRTFEVLAHVTADERESLALATRIARDVLSRLP
jgi:hypothetical protein